jgi:hypothetical protein
VDAGAAGGDAEALAVAADGFVGDAEFGGDVAVGAAAGSGLFAEPVWVDVMLGSSAA